MIYIDDNDPEGELEPSFPSRDVKIEWNTNPNDILELIDEIGRGKFGTVFKCKEQSTHIQLAVKFVPIPKREDRRNAEREVDLMNSLKHHLIIQLYSAYEFKKTIYIVQELVQGGELFDRVIDDEFILTEKVCTVFVRQICEAMQFVHKNNILHLDLKPENILCISKEGNRIKIIDFGLARKYDPDKKLQVLFGTPEFVAPEVVNFDNISYGTDMWSVGVICYVLLSGLSPFMGETDLETMANVTIAKYDFDDEAFTNVSSDALDFISKLLVKDLSTRMTASQCLEHKWLKRKPKLPPPPPPVSPKPKHIPPPKYKTTPPSPVPFDHIENEMENETKGLEQTKDNLKTFIERWEEHPNSPYIFDSESNLIAPIRDTKADSINSSRACSPSPCESISSGYPEDVTEQTVKKNEINQDLPKILQNTCTENFVGPSISITKHEPNINEKDFDQDFKDYLQSFDRRNSDTNYMLGRKSSGERVNLAEEIKKLSDHLLMLAEINTKLGTDKSETNNWNGNQSDVENSLTKQNGRKFDTDVGSLKTKSSKSSTKKEITEKSNKNKRASTLTIQLKNQVISNTLVPENLSVTKNLANHINGLTNIKTSATSTTQTYCNLNGVNKKKISSVNETIETNTPDSKNARIIATKNLFSNFPLSATSSNVSLGVPWTVKRTKFRINQSSRDVPVGSPNTHQAVNLEEAATNTKDCLLHLLEKYNTTKLRSGQGGRHQSISVDWNTSQNLEYRSMNSINTFFQRHANTSKNVKETINQIESTKNISKK